MNDLAANTCLRRDVVWNFTTTSAKFKINNEQMKHVSVSVNQVIILIIHTFKVSVSSNMRHNVCARQAAKQPRLELF
jgi:hypothetical protein